jgi:murein DD-endopeptidase MepM/ murein hydrolase activator NlpD
MALASKLSAAVAIATIASWTPAQAASPDTVRTTISAALKPADYFQFPLPTWEPHCLGFGSEWRYCNGTVLRQCRSNGAVWLHTGVDIKTGIQPVMAAANGVITGYIVDPVFRGGVLVRHETPEGIVMTQYWHVWPRDGFKVGTVVTKGQVFADIADMGSRTHFHFAVFRGDYEAHAWNGALPPSGCDSFPAFPYRFADPTAFIDAHEQPLPRRVMHHCRLDEQP